MITRYFFVLTVGLASLGILTAQETATRVSDFNFGVSGKSIITSVHAADGQLYANLNQFYGDDAAGLLSILNGETGAATPLIDPDQTQWFGGDVFLDQPAVFEAGGMVFGLQQDLASGNNLYRLDGPEPELLLSSGAMNYTQPVVFGDSLYFITGTLPLRQNPSDFGEILAELWRTDGTAAGTQLVSPLLSFATASFIRVVPGTDKLFIGIADDGSQVFYVYEPGEEGLSLVGEGFGQFIVDAPFTTVFNPIAYHNGAFYVYGASSFGGSGATLYRLEEETLAIQEIPLPELPGNFGLDNKYRQLEFQNFNDSLYLFAGRGDFGDNGNDLYRIGGPDGVTLTTIFAELESESVLYRDYSNSTIIADTMYYLSRQTGDSMFIYAYEANTAVPQELARFSAEGSVFFVSADDHFVYITIPERDQLVRYDKRADRLIRLTVEFYDQAYSFNSTASPIAVTSEGAYTVGSRTGEGLLFLAAEADTLTAIGDYITPNLRRNPFIYGVDSASNEIFLFGGSQQVYQGATDEFIDVSFPPKFVDPLFQSLIVIDGESFYHAADTLGRRRVLTLENGVFSEVPLSFSGDFDEEEYTLSIGTRINNNLFQVSLSPGNGDSPRRLLGTIEGNTLRLLPFLPEGFEDLQRVEFSGFRHFAIANNFGDDKEILIFDYETVPQYSFTVNSSAVIRALTPAGAFVESVNSFSFEPSMVFFPSDGSDAREMVFDTVVNAYSNRIFYPLNGRLLFVGDSPDRGREWLVADPATNSISILKDINPGRGFGTLTTQAAIDTETGLFFSANDGVNGNELWYTEGTEASTRMLPEINPGAGSSNPREFILIDSTLFFSANGPAGYELYRLHLRDNIPELIVDLHPGEGDAHPFALTRAGDDFYFFGREATGVTYELYRIAYDLVPTEAEPTRVAAKIFPNPVRDLPLTITAPEGESLERLQLFNQQGQLLREVTARGTSGRMDLSELPASTYWLRSWYTSGRFSINAVQHVR